MSDDTVKEAPPVKDTEQGKWYEKEVPENHARIQVTMSSVSESLEGKTLPPVTLCDVPVENIVSPVAAQAQGKLTVVINRDYLEKALEEWNFRDLIPDDSPFLQRPGAKFELPPKRDEIRVYLKGGIDVSAGGYHHYPFADIPSSRLEEDVFQQLDEVKRQGRSLTGLSLSLDQLKQLNIACDPHALEATKFMNLSSPAPKA